MQKFVSEPEKLAPQSGGYRAYGTSLGPLASIELAAWSVVAGKRYLRHSEPARDQFLRDPLAVLQRADGECPALLADPKTPVHP